MPDPFLRYFASAFPNYRQGAEPKEAQVKGQVAESGAKLIPGAPDLFTAPG